MRGRTAATIVASALIVSSAIVSQGVAATVVTPNACVYTAQIRLHATPTGTSASLDIPASYACAVGILYDSAGETTIPGSYNPCTSTSIRTITFAMRETTPYGAPPGQLSTWKLKGNKAGYTVDFASGKGDSGKGVLHVGSCPSFSDGSRVASGPLVLARVKGGLRAQTGDPLTTDVYRCHATGEVGPTFYGGGHDQFSGFEVSGPASGGGTCQSQHDSWNVTYTGSWTYRGSGYLEYASEYCGAGTMDLQLVLTSTSTGEVRTLAQLWSQAGVGGPAITVTGPDPLAFHYGAGTMVENPMHCGMSYQDSPNTFTTATTWAFAIQ